MSSLALFLNAVVLYEILALGNIELCDEGALIENISAGCFLFASVTLVFRSLSLEPFEKRLTLLFATTSLLFFFREVDVEDLNATRVIQWIGSDIGRDALFLLIYIYLTISTFRLRPASILTTLTTILRSEAIQLCIIGSIFLVIGGAFEQYKMIIVEEVLELNGALILLCAALVLNHRPIWKVR